MMIEVPVSAGELLDKITILEIKAARIADVAKRANVLRELELLSRLRDTRLDLSHAVRMHVGELASVNLKLWDVEDALRDHERAGQFDTQFVALARSVYHLNDERAALKKAINVELNSDLVEEKSYAPYASTGSTSS